MDEKTITFTLNETEIKVLEAIINRSTLQTREVPAFNSMMNSFQRAFAAQAEQVVPSMPPQEED